MFGQSPSDVHRPRGARGYRAYAIGDIHGRADLLDRLLAAIDDELEQRPVGEAVLVFLGDLIDRGPESRQVIERLRTYRREGVRSLFLLGNHEEVLLRILAGDAELIRKWRMFGGSECLESYGVDARDLDRLDDEAALAVVREAIPAEHVAFLETFADTFRFGDFLFVHAGIRPGVALADQQQTDLRWIREPFLLDDSDHGFVVVHGHSITPKVEERGNRIGIDTGAYRSGTLTALAIEDGTRWYLDTTTAEETAVSAAH